MQESEAPIQASESLHSSNSRPTTPDSQMSNSLYRATATMDELTMTLAKVSRAPSPDEADKDLLQCCCGRADCVHVAAWAAFHSKLESRLILCAQVGQALLEKHEAYVRRHGLDDDSDTQSDEGSVVSRPETPTIHSGGHGAPPDTTVSDLKRDNTTLEKKLNAALLNAEISESSKKSMLQELEEAKEVISRLTVNSAKSTGWETRLNTITQEKDDIRQELDAERQRSKASEAHVSALKERCSKLQSEMSHLYDDLDQQKQSRTELSDEILRDARARLQMIQQQQFGRTLLSDSPEVTQMMESLVADNEALKRDVAELQNLLTEAREDVRMLQEEVEESRVTSGSSRRVSSVSRQGHAHTFSWASSFGQAPLSPVSRSAAQSTAPYEPMTPNTDARPRSRADSRAASVKQHSALSSPRPNYPPHMTLEVEDRNARTKSPELPGRKSPIRPLMMLSQNKSVQTEEINWSNLLGPVFRAQTDDGSSATPPGEGRSESSSLADSHAHASTIAALVDRASSLFSRMAQADALTLLNRLKRQRLAGDVSHLSHATVSSILSEANGLRAHFRGVLEDERAISTCTRRDLRALLGLLREMFGELGQMRIALNDVILDPTIAPKLSAAAMDPTKGLNEPGSRGTRQAPTSASGWMAPFSKLFGGAATQNDERAIERPSAAARAASGPAAMNATLRQKPPKFVPKSGPALAASATTVNVEFSGAGIGRSVTSSVAPPVVTNSEGEPTRATTPVPGTMSSRAVMNIFAGAPQAQSSDPWVFVPAKPEKKLRSRQSTMDMRTATLTRTVGRSAGARLPRNVDAVVDSGSAIHDSDDEQGEAIETLLERTLRPRGLSDSSIRSTFLNDDVNPTSPAGNGPQVPVSTPISPMPIRGSLRGGSSLRQGAYPVQGTARPSVLQAFGRAFAIPALSTPSPEVPPSTNTRPTHSPDTESNRAASPRRGQILPSFAGWAASHVGLDADAAEDFVGSIRGRDEESNFGHRTWNRDMQGRDI